MLLTAVLIRKQMEVLQNAVKTSNVANQRKWVGPGCSPMSQYMEQLIKTGGINRSGIKSVSVTERKKAPTE